MEIRNIKINLTQMGAKAYKIQGQDFICLPLTEALQKAIYKGEKNNYLNLKVIDTQSQYSDCSVVLDLPKDFVQTEEEKKKNWIGQGKIFTNEFKTEEIENVEPEELPF